MSNSNNVIIVFNNIILFILLPEKLAEMTIINYCISISTGAKIMLMAFFFLPRHFRLHLTPNKDLFDEEFHAYSVGPNDVKTEIPINKDSFYRGYDEGMVRLLMIVIIVLRLNWQKN